MKLIIGLGNPGAQYERTRHNIGFAVVAEIQSMTRSLTPKARFGGEIFEGTNEDEKLLLLRPLTYMNASGQCVRKAVDFYKLTPDDCLVVCDDLNLATGRLRFRPSGSAGGQKGLADIIRHLGTESISRLRVGIGRPPVGWDVSDYVLGRFTDKENETVLPSIQDAAKAAVFWTKWGATETMNRYNASAPPVKGDTERKSNDSPKASKVPKNRPADVSQDTTAENSNP
jgi:peptidyl-tRNA hydrolase, PTH1 family